MTIETDYKEFVVEKLSRISFNELHTFTKALPDNSNRRELRIGASELTFIRELCEDDPLNSFTVYLSLYLIVLNRYFSQKAVVISSPGVLDSHAAERLFYAFELNDEGISLRDFIRSTVFAVRETIGHSRYLTSELIQDLAERNIDPALFCQFGFAHAGVNIPASEDEIQFNLCIHEEPSGDCVVALRQASGFEEFESPSEFLGHFRALVCNLNTNLPKSIREISILSDAEIHHLRAELNEPFEEQSDLWPVHSLFEKCVLDQPGQLAIVNKDIKLTYREVNEFANQVSFLLQHDYSIGPDKTVALVMDNSEWTIILIIAIFKAGGAYVPISPDYPAARIAYMIEDASPALVIYDNQFMDFKTENHSNLVDLQKRLPEFQTVNPSAGVSLSTLAYVIYTSGTTGSPKGVDVTHRSLANFFLSMKGEIGVVAGEVTFWMTTLAFDISILEMFLPLITGGTVSIIDRAGARDMAVVKNAIAVQNPSLIQATPTFWSILLDAGWKPAMHLKMISGGERLNPSIGRKLMGSGATLWNMYGPTETTIWSTCNKIRTEHDLYSIGRPIRNTSVYVLDKFGHLAPKGAVGELCIGGDGVARGYRNLPELSAQRFFTVNDIAAGDRIYKTGDLVRWTQEGTLFFLGRVDDQMKVRGHRIEPLEIESVLLRMEGIRQALVLPFGTDARDKTLAAFVVAASPIDKKEIMSFLEMHFPEFMLPKFVVTLDRIPMAANGKVDRKKLKELYLQEKRAENIVEPESPVEIKLAEIWKEILQMDRVSVEDNFFRIGGNSFSAIGLTNKINERLGLNIPSQIIFEGQTIRSIAQQIYTLNSWTKFSNPELKKIKHERRTRVAYIGTSSDLPQFFFCAPLGGVLPATSIVGVIDLALYLKDLVAFSCIQAPPLRADIADMISKKEQFDPRYLKFDENDFQRIVGEAVDLIVQSNEEGPYSLGGFCTGCVLTVEIAKRLIASGKVVKDLILVDPPDWVTGIKKKQLAYHYSFQEIAVFVNNDLGWSSPLMNLDQLIDYIKSHQDMNIWQACNAYMESIGLFSTKVADDEIRESFENKFFNDLILKLYFANIPYRYPASLKIANTLILEVEEFYKGGGLKSLFEGIIDGPVRSMEIAGNHHTLFLPGNLAQWASMISDQFKKVAVEATVN